MFIFAVLAAIDLDDDTSIKANEVEIVPSERRLPPDMESQGAQPFEAGPQSNLLARHRASELTSA